MSRRDELEGQTVLITGSSRGIGAATARVISDRGGRALLHGRTESRHLKELAEELGTRYLACDLASVNADGVAAAIEDLLAEEPQIDALINCAGQVNPRPFLDCIDDDWLLEVRANLLSTVHLCQAVAPMMTRRGYGRIVNVSSIRGERTGASARGMAYSAAKAAISNFTAALAKELAPTVNVNAVAPGFVQTDISATWNDTVRRQASSSLVGRAGDPSEIAELLVFLASPRASFITGQTIVADGGYLLSGK